jgi:anti-sigma B factor antagonist
MGDIGAPLQLQVDRAGDQVRIALRGELDVDTAPELWAAIDEAIAGGVVSILLDLSELSFADSTGLGVFVRAGKELRDAGGGLTLRHPGERIKRLLEITSLQEVFTFAD